MPQLVINPEASAAEQHEFVFAEPVEDALMDHLPGVSAVDDMLGLTDVELRKAVDRDVREELQHVRPLEAAFPEEGPVADVARLLPGHTLVHPVRVLGLPPPNRKVPLGRGP